MRFLLAASLLLFGRTSNGAPPSTLRFVQVLWRHGDRSPTDIFPTDSNVESKWTGGIGELTDDGVQQHYNFGKMIRDRYVGFLSETYNPKEIHVDSTYFNRTVMSALANLEGMYPAREGTVFWKPIPVFSRPRDDYAVWIEKPCPVYDTLFWDGAMKSKEVLDIMEQNKEFFTFLREKSGEKLPTLDDIWKLYDPLICETDHNDTNPRPSWVNDTVMAKIVDLYEVSTHYYYNDDTRRRIRGGGVLGEMIDRFDQYIAAPINFTLKYFAYSAHDTNIMALLEVLGAYQGMKHSPVYATGVFIELHEKTKGKYTIEVYYKNETDTSNFNLVSVSNCDDPCTYDQFKERSKDLIPDDWNAECGITTSQDYTWQIVAIVFIALFGLTLTVLISMIALQRKDTHKNRVT